MGMAIEASFHPTLLMDQEPAARRPGLLFCSALETLARSRQA
jgi:hypothetical protein